MSEQSTTERNRDTGPLPSLAPPPAPASTPQRQARSNRTTGLILGAIGLAIAGSVLFSVFRPGGLGNDQRPVETVQNFVAAAQAKDVSTMMSYVEPTIYRREVGPEVRLYMAYIDSMRFTDAQYEMLKNDGNVAQVRWTANMDYALRGRGAGQSPVDTTFDLVQIEGAWYLRGVQLPKP